MYHHTQYFDQDLFAIAHYMLIVHFLQLNLDVQTHVPYYTYFVYNIHNSRTRYVYICTVFTRSLDNSPNINGFYRLCPYHTIRITFSRYSDLLYFFIYTIKFC
uniref:Uncharacterized protein n=1 Tax=Cacopsylla melanoneura TaxID=428564 RepID=A0A8D9AGR0_9HEMI